MVIKYILMDDSLCMSGISNAKIPQTIFEKIGWHARNVEKEIVLKKPKRIVSTTG